MEHSTISANISSATLKLFKDSVINHKELLLKDIWETYLKDHIDFNIFKNEMLKTLKQDKEPVEVKTEPNKTQCKAKVWNNITKTYAQCKFKPKSCNYCEKHIEKRNYGDFY